MLKVNSNEMFLLFFTRKELESVVFVKELYFIENFSLTFAKHFII